MKRGLYECKNKIIVNHNEKILKLNIIERHPNSTLNSFLYYSDKGILKNNEIKNIEIFCNECGKSINIKTITFHYINDEFLCRSCRVNGDRNGMFNKKHSLETLKKFRNRKGELNGFFEKKHTEEYKQKKSMERKGIWYVGMDNSMYGISPLEKMIEKYGEKEANRMWNEKKLKHSIQMTINNPFKGKTHNEETKEKIRIASKTWVQYMKTENPNEWEQYLKNISNSLKDRVFTEEHKKNLRLSTIKRIKRNKGQLNPCYNPTACEYFNLLMEQTGTHIQHAENGGEFYIKELGYWVDGYDKENNIVYEYDEKFHGRQIEKDKQRQTEIEEFLGCKFIRIQEDEI